MIGFYVVLLLLSTVSGQETTNTEQDRAATEQGSRSSDQNMKPTVGQQTAIGERDNSTNGRVLNGRILSRRETRLDTRITRGKLTSLVQSTDAEQKGTDMRSAAGRPGSLSGRF